MPGFDRTGPVGQGPMTGGGFGYCGRRDNTGPDFGHRRGGGRLGGGYGYGLGHRRRFGRGIRDGVPPRFFPFQGANPDNEIVALRQEANDLKSCLKEMEMRISKIEQRSA